jgi:hypothetical protein
LGWGAAGCIWNVENNDDQCPGVETSVLKNIYTALRCVDVNLHIKKYIYCTAMRRRTHMVASWTRNMTAMNTQ